MKQSQKDVNYRRGGLGQGQCGKCSMYRKSGDGQFGSCTAVTGKITPWGVCNLVAMVPNPFGPHPVPNVVQFHHNKLARLVQ